MYDKFNNNLLRTIEQDHDGFMGWITAQLAIAGWADLDSCMHGYTSCCDHDAELSNSDTSSQYNGIYKQLFFSLTRTHNAEVCSSWRSPNYSLGSYDHDVQQFYLGSRTFSRLVLEQLWSRLAGKHPGTVPRRLLLSPSIISRSRIHNY